MGTDSLQREIEGLQTRLDPASGGRTIDELARIRRDLADTGERKPAFDLPNLRLGFVCKKRWEDMVGDDRVRACNGCERPVFNLSAMTRPEAERLLATRGLTPCVRFYRRPDGTVMTSDCPSGERREKRRLAVVASSVAAGAALVAPSVASAENESTDDVDNLAPQEPVEEKKDDDNWDMGEVDDERGERDDYLMGDIAPPSPLPRPKLEWSVWGRFGMGVHSQQPTVLARSLTPPEARSSTMWEAALAVEVTVGVAHEGNIRLGTWAEARTSSGPVAGGELVIGGLPPRATRGGGTIVVRAGGNAHVFTTALALGYVGSWPHDEPWMPCIKHLVGARFVASVNRSLDDPRDWSATFGLEVEPLGVLHAMIDFATDD